MFGTRARSAAGRGAALAAAAIAAVSLVLVADPPERAGAGGGDWVTPARDRYEAGQQVTMIGYGGGLDAALLAHGPFYAWLRVDPAAAAAALAASSLPGPGVHRSDLRVGEVTVEHVGAAGGIFGRDQRGQRHLRPPGRPAGGPVRGAVLQRPVHARARLLHRGPRQRRRRSRPPARAGLAADGSGDPVARGRRPPRASVRRVRHRRGGPRRRGAGVRPRGRCPGVAAGHDRSRTVRPAAGRRGRLPCGRGVRCPARRRGPHP